MELFIGGFPLEEDKVKLKSCHIAVGAPGRLRHLIEEKHMKTDSIRLFVLDEADRLIETNMQEDINYICSKLPSRKQMIASSATYPNELDKLLANYMTVPTHVSPDTTTPLLLGLKQFICEVKSHLNVIQQLKIKTEALKKIFSNISYSQCIVFFNYQTRTESICNYLNADGWEASYITGAQMQKERIDIINQFKMCKKRILLSTDLTARGIDLANVDLVVNYDIPNDVTTYLHRMGRAGRYGSEGVCITIASSGGDIDKMQKFLWEIGGNEMRILKFQIGNLEERGDLLKGRDEDFEFLMAKGDIDESDCSQNVDDSNENKCHDIKNKDLIFDMKQRRHYARKNEKNGGDNKNNCNNSGNHCNYDEIDTLDILMKLAESGSYKLDIKSEEEDREKGGKNKEVPKENERNESEEEEICGKDERVNLNNEKFCLKNEEDLHLIKEDKNFKNEDRNFKNEKKTNFREYITSDTKVNRDNNTLTFLEKLAKGEISKTFSPPNLTKDEILLKNLALLNLTKILVQDETLEEIPDKTAVCVNQAISLNKLAFESSYGKVKDFQESEEIPDENKESTNQVITLNKLACKSSYEEVEDLQSIFVASYRYAVNLSKVHWTDKIGIQEESFLVQNLSFDRLTIESSETSENDMIFEDYFRGRNKRKRKNRRRKYKQNKEKKQDEDSLQPSLEWVPVENFKAKLECERNNFEVYSENDGNNFEIEKNCNRDKVQMGLEWIPIENDKKRIKEYSESNRNNFDIEYFDKGGIFESYFEEYSKSLHIYGRNFKNVSIFNRWFEQWKLNLNSVRDYVQQNIYLNEMNNS